jgi:ubiquinone biosynthesis accessory factor UbiK
MIDNDFLQKLSARAAGLFPAADAAREKLERELYSLLQSNLAKLNIVTREEFVAQTRLLEQARAQMAALEEKVAALERDAGK